MEWNGMGRMFVFEKTILVIFYNSKWFENSLENSLKNSLENGLTLQISRWYKLLRFKDIVQGFRKLKKWVKKNEMECDGLQDQKSRKK